MKTFNNFYIKAFFALCGFLIVFWTLYMRFLRPRAIGEVDFTYSNTKLCMYIFLIFIFSIVLISAIFIPIFIKILKNFNKNPNKDTNFFKLQEKFVKFSGKIHEFYEKSIEAFYQPLYKKLVPNFPLIWYFCYNFAVGSQKHFEIYLIIFSYLPPCIISVTYFIEVVILNKFTYFPLAIFLMIFPIGLRICLYNIQMLAKHIEDEVNLHIRLVEKFPNKEKVWKWTDASNYIDEFKTNEQLNAFVEVKEENKLRIELFDLYRKYLNSYYVRPYFIAFSSTFWLISFSYMVYRILN
jgi:hypothetical protein